MALKQPALIAARDNRKKKKEENILKAPAKKETVKQEPVKKVVNNKGTTYVDKKTISKKPTVQNTTRKPVVTNKERLTSKSTFNNVNKPTTTVKTTKNKQQRQKYSAGTYDIYERDGKYYYNDGKEKQIDTKFVQNAIKNNKKGVIGRYNSKGKLKETDENGNVKTFKGKTKDQLKEVEKQIKAAGSNIKKGKIGLSQQISDVANIADAAVKLPGIKQAKAINDTRNQAIINATHGILKAGENVVDLGAGLAGVDTSDDSVRRIEKWLGYSDKEREKAEEDSLIKSNNLGGKVFQAGGQLLADVATGEALFGAASKLGQAGKLGKVGKYIGNPEAMTSLKGLTGATKAKAVAKNAGINLLNKTIQQAPVTLGAGGGAFEEASSANAKPEEQREYALKRMGVAFIVNNMFNGIPGLKNDKGFLDRLAGSTIGKPVAKITEKLPSEKLANGIKAVTKGVGAGAGEAFEENIEGVITAMLKNSTYSEGEKYTLAEAKEDALIAFILGGLFEVGNIKSEIDTENAINQRKAEIKEALAKDVKLRTELDNVMNRVLKKNGIEATDDATINELKNQLQQTEYAKQVQANEINQRVKSGEIDAAEGLALLDQVNNGTYTQNRNLEMIATQQKAILEQQLQQGQITPQEYTQEVQNLANTVNQTREQINAPQQTEATNNQQESTQESTINDETKVKQVENKSDLKEVVDEDKYNVDIKDVENQIYRENYKLNEDVNDEDGPVGNYWDIDDTYFKLKDGNTLWITTPTEYGKLKNGKTNYNDEIHNKIKMFIEDADGKVIDEYNLTNEKGEFSREDVLNGIKQLTYDDSNKQPEGQIDMFGNVHVSKTSNNIETNQNENIPAKTQDNVISANTIVEDFNNAKDGDLDGKKLRSYIETSNEATKMQKSIKKADLDKITYEVKSNKETYEKAQNNLKNLSYEERIARSKNLLNSDKKIKAVDMAEAQIALLEAAQSGRVQDYLDLQQDIAIMGTELGQTVQAMSMIQKMSPDGQIATLLKIVNRKQKTGNKAWEGVELKPELVQKVLDSYDDASHTTFDKNKMDQAVDELKQDLADQMKVTKTEKINEWRYLSMLGNPKTHVRNLVGNTAMSVVKSIKDLQSAALQDLLIHNAEGKTATLKPASKAVKQLSDVAFDEMMVLDKKGSKYTDVDTIEEKRQIFNNKVLEKLRKGNLKALNVEDNLFKKAHFKRSFSNYLTAKGISTTEDINNNPQLVADAKMFAMNEAKIATFQNENSVAKWIRDLDNLGKPAQVIRGAIIPFTGVPVNIAKVGIEYTPGTGMLKTISDFKKAPKSQKGNVLIDGISKQVTGTSLAILGYALAKSGLVGADAGDDKDDKYLKDLGAKMNYSIKIGDTSYDLSWLSPSSMPFFVGASAYEQWEKKEGLDVNFITEALASTIDPLSEMSVISGFTDVLTSYNTKGAGKIKEAGESTLQNYLSQFIPTIFSQFARTLDDTKRNTYANKNSKWTYGEETLKKLQYKIPGVRNLLPEQTDYFGNNKKEQENILKRSFESFLSPSNTKKDTSNKISEELINLYNETGEKGVIPSKSDSYIKYKDEKYDLTQREYNQLKKDYGTVASEEIDKALNNKDYQKLSKDKQAEVISNILKYARFKSKDNYFDSKGIDYTNSQFSSAKKAEESGYAIADYYITKKVTTKEKSKSTVSTNRYEEMKAKGIDGETFDKFKAFVSTAKADKTANGGYVRGSKKQKIINYIQSLPLSAKAKQSLWEDYQKNTGYFQYYK